MPQPRTPWHDFPDAYIHASETAVKKHPRYRAAKSGDADAAAALVADTFSNPKMWAMAGRLTVQRQNAPTLVSAHAYEMDGVNAIPEAFAEALGRQLGWPVDGSTLQTNVVAHTGADGWSRIARQAAFDGPVQAGCSYVMVDDFLGMGGTLANLRGHIEAHGGKVVTAVVLTGKPYSAKLAPSAERLLELRARHGHELENWWRLRFGHAFDALTESEVRYLTRAENADTVRNRLAAAEQAGDCTAPG